MLIDNLGFLALGSGCGLIESSAQGLTRLKSRFLEGFREIHFKLTQVLGRGQFLAAEGPRLHFLSGCQLGASVIPWRPPTGTCSKCGKTYLQSAVMESLIR